jgi:hypothetical protein
MAGEKVLMFFSRQKSPKCASGGGDVQIRSTNKNVVILYVYLHIGTTKSCFSAKKERE